MRFSVLLFSLLLFHSSGLACKRKYIPQESFCLAIQQSWMHQYLKLTKQSVGFSAPVAARAFNYVSIGSYETVVELLPDNKSLTGQLRDYQRSTWKEDEEINFPHALNIASYTLAKFYFKNMPPAMSTEIDNHYNSLYKTYKAHSKRSVLKRSEEYAKQIVNEVIEWSKTDGGFEAYDKNFPAEFQPEMCTGCWLKTHPGYKSALLPYWGQNKLLIPSNRKICDDIPYIPFSSEKDSEFYKEVDMISQLYLNLTEEQEIIAEYWDDGPGVSGTPIGHLFSIGLQLSEDQNLSFQSVIELYTKLGIALNDVVIEAWRLKYKYNLIRPITYIQRYIRKDFNTAIVTPPFPEFPSGHSFQSGAGSEVLKDIFGNNLAFCDSTNVTRNDIDGSPRRYANFTEMSEEMSISRFYGGIHYKHTLDVSLAYGRKIGVNTLNRISLR